MKLELIDIDDGRKPVTVPYLVRIPGFWITADWLWMDPLPLEPDCLKEIEG